MSVSDEYVPFGSEPSAWRGVEEETRFACINQYAVGPSDLIQLFRTLIYSGTVKSVLIRLLSAIL